MILANRLWALLLCLFFVIGCGARQTTVFRKFDVNQSESVAMDAKQRVILVAQKNGETKVCAEPSPDALAAIGASLAAGASYKDINATVQAAIAESASSFGVRNATIQLLRDGLYRLCEAHLNDAINNEQYRILANKYEDLMLTLLAVEKLTSIAHRNDVHNVVLNTQASIADEHSEPAVNGESKPTVNAEGKDSPVIEVNNPALSANDITTISASIERLVEMMFDYWRHAYEYSPN